MASVHVGTIGDFVVACVNLILGTDKPSFHLGIDDHQVKISAIDY